MKTTTLKRNLGLLSLMAFITLVYGFNEAWFQPGLTQAEPFDLATNTSFPAGGTSTDPYEVAFPNLQFDSPITFSLVPNQNSIVIGQLDGRIFWIEEDNNTTVKTEIVNFSAEVGDRNEGQVWDGGFLGLSIHPDFGTGSNKDFFYIYYTTATENPTLGTPQGFFCNVENFSGNYLILERFEVNPVTMQFVSGSRLTMIRRQLYNTTHRGGGMEFGDDGFLYLSTGDQAAYANAQELDENLDGGVLRLDVDMIGGSVSHAPIRTLSSPGAGEPDEFSGIGYFIPNDNPFPSPGGETFEEYYTIGHRNPHRMTKDRATGIFYIGEIGESTHEEINVVGAGNNYGWPLFEANANFNPGCSVSLYPGTAHSTPLAQFSRSEARSIIGGYVYRGSNIPELVGKYIAADYIQNTIWEIDINTGQKQLLGNFGPQEVISFGQDSQGELYFLKLGDGVNLYRLKSSLATGTAPALLSQTGVFSDLQSLTVSDGFIPYEMIEPFWSDGAYKTRFMAIPNDGTHNTPEEQIEWSENGDWQFPIGSVLVKHFDYPIDDDDPTVTRKIETRFSIKGTDGNFYFLTYKWLPDESDAELVDMTVGDTANITVTTSGGGTRNVNWLYPSNSQCIACHSPALGGSLGPRTRFLNSDFDYAEKGGVVGNQLETLSALGILDETITDLDTSGYLTHVRSDDLTATLEERARSYMDNNCAYCHQPATGNRAQFDLRLINTLAQTGLLNAGINQQIPAMDADQRILFPGDASKSQLYHRTASLDPGIMMPPLAKGIVDEEGVALLEAWINQMNPFVPAPDTGDYRIVNVATGQTLQVENGQTGNAVNVVQGGYSADDSQHFAFETATLPFYQFRALHSGRYLDVESSNPDPGANVWQFASNGTPAQQWEVVDAGNNSFHIINRIAGNFLGVNETEGNVFVDVDDDSDRFRWRFEDLGTPADRGILLNKNIVSTSEDGDTAEFAVVLEGEPTDDIFVDIAVVLAEDEVLLSTDQLTFTALNWDEPQSVTITGLDDAEVDGPVPFQIELVVNGSSQDENYIGFRALLDGANSDNDGGGLAPPDPGQYRIVNVESDLTLEVEAESIDDFANIIQGPYEAGGHEQFELIYLGDGLYQLISVSSGKYLDVEFSNTNPGANVIQFRGNGSDAQRWRILDAGDGNFHIISELSGFYLNPDGSGNVNVDADDSTERFRWRFFSIDQSNAAGINVTPQFLITDESGESDSFSVVLNGAPSADVTLQLDVTQNSDEIALSAQNLIFTTENWDQPQLISVSGIDDAEVDGFQDFVITINVAAPINAVEYTGLGVTLNGVNYDDDGGPFGLPQPGNYQIVNVQTGENLTVEGGLMADEANIVSEGYQSLSNQDFALEFIGNGNYKLRALHSDKYVDVQSSNLSPGANVWQFTANLTDAQNWQLSEVEPGIYYIISTLSGHYLTIGPDGNIQVDIDDDTEIFRWQFLPIGFPPEVVATADITSGNAPLSVQFSGSGSTDDKDDIVNYLWDFGNGDMAESADVTYEFTEGGVYQVTLTIKDGDGHKIVGEPITITVNGAPEAVASADIFEGNAPLVVQFTGSASTDDNDDIVSYNWDFGNGDAADTADVSYEFTEGGIYEVVLTVSDGGGLSSMGEAITITVNGAPEAVATADITSGNPPLTVQFTGSGSIDDNDDIVGYLWDFGNGDTADTADVEYTFNEEGVYTVVLTVVDGAGLESSDSITISANGSPQAIAEADITNGNAPLTVQFTGSNSTDDSDNIVSYTWDFGNGEISDSADVSYTFTEGGTYDVVLTVVDGDGLSNTSQPILITINGAPQAIATADITSGNPPLTVQFTGSGSTDDNDDIVGYTWDFGDGQGSSSEADPSYTFVDSGVFTVVLTVEDGNGLTNSTELVVNVNGVPVSVANADVMSGEAPLTVNFTGNQSTDDIGITSYFWNFGDGQSTSDAANPEFTFNEPGNYTVTLTVEDAGGLTDSTELVIMVNEANLPPVAVITASTGEGFAPLSIDFGASSSIDDNDDIVSYLWDFGNGDTGTNENVTYEYTVPGTYTVTLTITDGGGLENATTIEVVVLENETSSSSAFMVVAPNPVSEAANISIGNLEEDRVVTKFLVHDSAGRLIAQYTPNEVFSSQNVYSIPVNTLRSELYLITAEFNSGEPVIVRMLVNN